EPPHPVEMVRRVSGEVFALAGTELPAGLEDQVAPRPAAFYLQPPQNLRREAAGPGAELEEIAARETKQLRELRRQRLAEEGGNFRRGDEVATRSELGRAGRVVAQARRVQHQVHVARKGDPAARGGDLFRHARAHFPAVRGGVGGWGR